MTADNAPSHNSKITRKKLNSMSYNQFQTDRRVNARFKAWCTGKKLNGKVTESKIINFAKHIQHEGNLNVLNTRDRRKPNSPKIVKSYIEALLNLYLQQKSEADSDDDDVMEDPRGSRLRAYMKSLDKPLAIEESKVIIVQGADSNVSNSNGRINLKRIIRIRDSAMKNRKEPVSRFRTPLVVPASPSNDKAEKRVIFEDENENSSSSSSDEEHSLSNPPKPPIGTLANKNKDNFTTAIHLKRKAMVTTAAAMKMQGRPIMPKNLVAIASCNDGILRFDQTISPLEVAKSKKTVTPVKEITIMDVSKTNEPERLKSAQAQVATNAQESKNPAVVNETVTLATQGAIVTSELVSELVKVPQQNMNTLHETVPVTENDAPVSDLTKPTLKVATESSSGNTPMMPVATSIITTAVNQLAVGTQNNSKVVSSHYDITLAPNQNNNQTETVAKSTSHSLSSTNQAHPSTCQAFPQTIPIQTALTTVYNPPTAHGESLFKSSPQNAIKEAQITKEPQQTNEVFDIMVKQIATVNVSNTQKFDMLSSQLTALNQKFSLLEQSVPTFQQQQLHKRKQSNNSEDSDSDDGDVVENSSSNRKKQKTYQLTPGLNSVLSIYKEWFLGSSKDLPSVIYLQEMYKESWRAGFNSEMNETYRERRLIAKKICSLSLKHDMDLSNAAKYLEQQRIEKGLTMRDLMNGLKTSDILTQIQSL